MRNVFYICAAAELLFVPLFLKYSREEKNYKSLVFKMICASLFVAAGVFATLSAERADDFGILMIAGLCTCWLGDLLLHIPPKKRDLFLFGTLSFLCGHLFYITAFSRAIARIFPGISYFDGLEIAAFCIMELGLLIILKLLKMKMGRTAAVVLPYGAVIIVMGIKAQSLGLRMLLAELPQGKLMVALTAVGVVSFFLSDMLLGFLRFKTHRPHFGIKVINIVTYFGAQICLAATILLVP